MLKVRLMGVEEDMEWFIKQIKNLDEIEILRASDVFPNKGTNRYLRMYLEVENNLKKQK